MKGFFDRVADRGRCQQNGAGSDEAHRHLDEPEYAKNDHSEHLFCLLTNALPLDQLGIREAGRIVGRQRLGAGQQPVEEQAQTDGDPEVRKAVRIALTQLGAPA